MIIIIIKTRITSTRTDSVIATNFFSISSFLNQVCISLGRDC